MNPKTKAKVEAMAEKLANSSYAESEAFVLDGATPWAEWCERLAECKNHEDHSKVLEEYRQWLEDVEL